MRTRARAAAAAVMTAAVLLVVACGTARSVESYCTTFYGEAQEFRQRFLDANADADPVGAIGQLLSAPHDLAVFFGKLADVAPEEIRDDVETARDAFQAQADRLPDKARDIAGGLAGGLGSVFGDLAEGMAAAPAMQRVDTWTTQHCGPPPTG